MVFHPKVYMELKDHEEYRIYLYPRGWFYTKLSKGRVEHIEVKRGQVISFELTIQVRLQGVQCRGTPCRNMSTFFFAATPGASHRHHFLGHG